MLPGQRKCTRHGIVNFRRSERIVVSIETAADQHLSIGKQVRVMCLTSAVHRLCGCRERIGRRIENFRARQCVPAVVVSACNQHLPVRQQRCCVLRAWCRHLRRNRVKHIVRHEIYIGARLGICRVRITARHEHFSIEQ